MTEPAAGGSSGMPVGFIAPDTVSQCSWSRDHSNLSPHHCQPNKNTSLHNSILPNILEMIGNTPMVRLDKIAKSEGLQCDLLGKCEFFNAGGSVKDRIGLRMVEEAEREGILKPGDVVIEPTSGNTGIGLALVAAVKGYKCIVTMPEKMSLEKESVLRALGAEIVRTPAVAFDSPDSNVVVAWRLRSEIPHSHVLDQHRNPGNPLAHYDGTAEEIMEQCGGKVDMVIVGAGTGGTVAGIGRKFKEKMPHVQIIGVDAVGSILAEPPEMNKGAPHSYQVEGIGDDFLPTVLDRSVIDQWYKASDRDSFLYARRLIREEGLLCGGSSGSAVAVAVKAAKSLKAGQRCVVILPDSIRNYLSKCVDDRWMVQYGYLKPDHEAPPGAAWWWNQPVTVLPLQLPITVDSKATCSETMEVFHREKEQQLAITNGNGSVVLKDVLGMVTLSNMTSKIVTGVAKPSDPVTKVIYKQFPKVDTSATLSLVSQILRRKDFVVVMHPKKEDSEFSNTSDGGTGGTPERRGRLHSVVTNMAFMHYICSCVPQK